MTCTSCNAKVHTCSSCSFDRDEEFAYYTLGICFKCFQDKGFEKIYYDFEEKQENDRNSFIEELKKKL